MAFIEVPHEDERLAVYRSVGDPGLARRLGLFVAEGRYVVKRLIFRRPDLLESILVSPTAAAALGRVLEGLHVPVYVASRSQLEAVAGFSFHQGCLALARRPPDAPLEEVVNARPLVLVLEAVANVDNVGSAFRSAAAFGAAVVLSPDCGDPYYRKAIRTSMGAVLGVPFSRSTSWPADLARLRSRGMAIAALSPRASMSIDDYARSEGRPGALALVAGAEGAGVSRQVEELADVRLSIPIHPEVDSLNVGVAIGIALARFARVGG